jgi:hypothetical protein
VYHVGHLQSIADSGDLHVIVAAYTLTSTTTDNHATATTVGGSVKATREHHRPVFILSCDEFVEVSHSYCNMMHVPFCLMHHL